MTLLSQVNVTCTTSSSGRFRSIRTKVKTRNPQTIFIQSHTNDNRVSLPMFQTDVTCCEVQASAHEERRFAKVSWGTVH